MLLAVRISRLSIGSGWRSPGLCERMTRSLFPVSLSLAVCCWEAGRADSAEASICPSGRSIDGCPP